MNYISVYDNSLNIYYVCISSGFVLISSLYYFFRSNNIAIPTQNMEAFTHEEIEAIIKENATTVINSENIDDIIDSYSDTDTEISSDYESLFPSATTADFDEILKDPDLLFMPPFESKFKLSKFIMPDVDLNVCPLAELKLFEFCSLYGQEMAEHSITEEDMMELLGMFQEKDLATN